MLKSGRKIRHFVESLYFIYLVRVSMQNSQPSGPAVLLPEGRPRAAKLGCGSLPAPWYVDIM